MSITFKDAVDNNLISPNILNIIPNKCKCGSPLVISDSLRELRCTNDSCINIVIGRCKTFCEKLGLRLSVDDIQKIVNKFNIMTPYQLLMLDAVYDSGMITDKDVSNIKDNIQILRDKKENEYFIYEVIELSSIQELDNIAKKLFDGFNSVDEVFEEIESGRIIFINERLGIRSSDSTILSVEIYNRIMDLREELIFAETQLKIKKYNKLIRIAFADSIIGNFLNKSEFIEYLNYMYDIHFSHVSTINNNTDILLKSGNSVSTKIRTARAINEKYIAESINSNKFTLNDIGKFKDGELKPIGSRVYIDTFENVMDRLSKVLGDNNV